MRKLYLIIIIIASFTTKSLSQGYILCGKVMNEKNIALQFSTVVLMKDSLILGGLATDSTGCFIFNNLKEGEYELHISNIGYKPFISLLNLKENTDLNEIYLKEDVLYLNQITVMAKMPRIRREFDRFIIDMKNTVIVKGKNILQSLNYTPGIIIDRNKNIVLNGKEGVIVMINGKKVNMSGGNLSTYLQNMRAEDVERIEIIANPDARYDSEGQGGIIDIYLRKDAIQGINGSIYSTYLNAHEPGYVVGTNLNINHKKLTFTSNFSYKNDKDYYKEIETLHFLQTDNRQFSESTRKYRDTSFTYRVGLQYDFSTKHSVGLEIYGTNTSNIINGSSNVLIESSAEEDSTTWMKDINNGRNNITSYSLNYFFKINPKGRKIGVICDYTTVNREGSTLYDLTTNQLIDYKKENYSDNIFQIFTSQIDYVHPFQKNYNISAGFKYSNLKSTIDEMLENFINNTWEKDEQYTYFYRFKENLIAGYLNLSYKFKKIEGSLGLRAEYDNRNFEEKNENQFNLFPSFQIKYNHTSKLYYSLSYTKRINRPPYRSMVPYYFFNTPYMITRGNPDLKPSLVNALNMTIGYRKYILTMSFDDIKNTIYILSDYESQTGITTQRNSNVKTGKIMSVNLTLPFTITKWWESYNNIVIRHKFYNDNNFKLYTKNTIGIIQSGNSFSLPKNTEFEVNITVMSPGLAGPILKQQGGIMFDLGLSKDFFNNKVNFSINVEDITGLLNNLKERTNYNDFESVSYTNFNQRKISLSIRYNFKTGKNFNARTNNNSNWEEKQRLNEK